MFERRFPVNMGMLDVVVCGNREPSEFSYTADGEKGPPRVDILEGRVGTELVSLDQAECDEMIDTLLAARQHVWGPYKQYVVAVHWDEPEEGMSVYGPYRSKEDAKAAIPGIERFFVNPYASAAEAVEDIMYRGDHGGVDQIRSHKQCGDMGFEWGGVIPDDVVFEIQLIGKI